MKNLALDIGNVLCHVDFEKILTVLSKSLNISRAEALYFLNRTQKLHDLGLTNLTDELHDHFKIKSEFIINEILTEWNRAIQWDQDIISEIAKLQDKLSFKVALVSNIGIEHAAHLRGASLRDTNAVKLITTATQFFSCEVGARKPNYLYYQTFLNMYPEFKEAIYIDDLDINLEIGRKFGLVSTKFVLSDYKKHPLDNLLVGSSKIASFVQGLETTLKS